MITQKSENGAYLILKSNSSSVPEVVQTRQCNTFLTHCKRGQAVPKCPLNRMKFGHFQKIIERVLFVTKTSSLNFLLGSGLNFCYYNTTFKSNEKQVFIITVKKW